MTPYIARVELRGDPPPQDYETLHDLMKTSFGFLQKIWEQNGLSKEIRQLPHATYSGAAEGPPDQLRKRMEDEITGAIKRESVVFVAPIVAGSSTTPPART